MSKKRGVVVSIAEKGQIITKSKSAQVNLLNPDNHARFLNTNEQPNPIRSVAL
jgi:hypothetical protein